MKREAGHDSGPNRARLIRWSARTCAALGALAFVAAAFATDAAGQALVDGITESYRTASLIWTGRLIRQAQRLFVLLAGFEVVASATILLLRPRRLDDAAGGFVVKILVMSICFFAITSFELVVPPIFDSFVAAGRTAAVVPSLNPAMVGGMGIMLAGSLASAAATGPLFLNQPMFVVCLVCALLVAIAYAGIACQIVYTLVEGYVVMSAGVFFLGFAAFRGTAQLADNYLMYLVHVGAKVLLLYLLVPIGVTLTTRWADSVRGAPFWDLTAPLEVLMSAMIFCGLVTCLPGSFARRITGGASLGIAQALRNT